MQGYDSSLAEWTPFNTLTTASQRVLRWVLRISWKRIVGTSGWAVVGTSEVDSTDTVRGATDILTEADKWDWIDETSRLVRFEYDRVLQEPLGGMAMCIGDYVLENADGRFTPNQNATIGTAILPNRPIQSYIGFLVGAVQKTVAIFKGLTEQPMEDKAHGTVSISSYDYIKSINEFKLESAVYENQRSDQIIADILSDCGIGTSQYVLDIGLNTIGFAWFTKGDTAGERIKAICEAEEAFFYQDENGILRFENRRHYGVSPHATSVWNIDPMDIITWERDDSVPIYNRVIVKAEPKQIAASDTVIWTHGFEETIARGETKEVWASFSGPVYSNVTPAATTDYTAFTATGGGGTNITSSISIVVTLFAEAAKIQITNNGLVPAYVNFLQLRGKLISVKETIHEEYEDSASQAKYGECQLEIENDFIDSRSFAYYLARAIVAKYKDTALRVVINCQGIPQLQLRDKVTAKNPETGNPETYRVMRIRGNLEGGLFTQTISLRKIEEGEVDSWAIVDLTKVGAEHEFVGA